MNREEARALLPEYALDILPPETRTAVEAWLQDTELRTELDAMREGLTDFAAALTPSEPVMPSADVRARLMASATGPDRFSAVMHDIARYCDLALDGVRAVLRQLDDSSKWEAGPLPGMALQHFDHGPAAAFADTGFIRYPPDFAFPKHRHRGFEVTIVLEGAMIDHDGRSYGPGSVIEYEDGTAHHFKAGPDGLTIVICITGYEIV